MNDEVECGRVVIGEKEMAKPSACFEDTTGLLYPGSSYYLETLEECGNRVMCFVELRCMDGGKGANKPYILLFEPTVGGCRMLCKLWVPRL